jgi:hypothetical protein
MFEVFGVGCWHSPSSNFKRLYTKHETGELNHDSKTDIGKISVVFPQTQSGNRQTQEPGNI